MTSYNSLLCDVCVGEIVLYVRSAGGSIQNLGGALRLHHNTSVFSIETVFLSCPKMKWGDGKKVLLSSFNVKIHNIYISGRFLFGFER